MRAQTAHAVQPAIVVVGFALEIASITNDPHGAATVAACAIARSYWCEEAFDIGKCGTGNNFPKLCGLPDLRCRPPSRLRARSEDIFCYKYSGRPFFLAQYAASNRATHPCSRARKILRRIHADENHSETTYYCCHQKRRYEVFRGSVQLDAEYLRHRNSGNTIGPVCKLGPVVKNTV